MQPLRGRAVLSFAVILALVAEAAILGDPGFGTFRKRKIDLELRRPAVVRLANTSIGFKSAGASPAYRPVLAPLEATLETELVGNERTLVKKPASEAEWVVSVTVTAFSPPAAKKRVENVKGSGRLTYVRWSASLNMAYQVVDKSGRVHDADNVASAYDREFQQTPASGSSGVPAIPFLGGGGQRNEVVPQTADDVRQILVQQVVQRIATNLGNTTQRIEAQVAAGETRLDLAADLIERRLWARAIEELEKMSAFAKPEDESYRQYNFGLAYEGMSYESRAYNEQRANLFKAQEYYDKAAELNRGQRYFLEVIARTKDSVARYRTLDAMQKSDLGSVARSAEPPAAPALSKPPTKTVMVADVLELFAAGVPEEQITEIIRTAPGQYDLLDTATVLAVTRAKLPLLLQNEMRKKAGLPPLSSPASSSPTPGPSPGATTPAQASPPASKPAPRSK